MSCILLGSVTTELRRDLCGERSYTRFLCDTRPAYCQDKFPLTYGESRLVSGHVLGSYVTHVLHTARISYHGTTERLMVSGHILDSYVTYVLHTARIGKVLGC